MTKEEAIDLAIDSMWTVLRSWQGSPDFDSVYGQVERAVEVLNNLRSGQLYPTEHAYETACKALEKYRKKANIAKRELEKLSEGIVPINNMSSKAQEILQKMDNIK